VCSLARANDRDIARAAEALEPARSRRIHTFIATSPLHMEKKLRMTPDQVFEQAKLAVRFARQFTDDVEFSPETATARSPTSCAVLEAVIAEGATTINIPDTSATPCRAVRQVPARPAHPDSQLGQGGLERALPQRPRDGGCQLARGRDDRGRAQVECTVNGLGERAGNCSLEEVVMAVRTAATFSDSMSDRHHADRARIEAGIGHHRFPVQRTRRWSAPTRSPTRRASTRTAC